MEQVDPDSLVSRVERTLWAVWGFITEAVNRVLRPQLDNNIGIDLNAPGVSHAENSNPGEGETTREQVLSTASLPNASRLHVARDLCSSRLASVREEESEANDPLLNNSSNKCEEVESTNKQDDSMVPSTRNTNNEEPETSINDECEHVKRKSQNLMEDAVFPKIEGPKHKAHQEETVTLVTPDELKKSNEADVMSKDPLQLRETQDFRYEEDGIQTWSIQAMDSDAKSGIVNTEDAGKQHDAAIVTQEEAEHEACRGQMFSEDALVLSGPDRETTDHEEGAPSAGTWPLSTKSTEDETIPTFLTNTGETTGILTTRAAEDCGRCNDDNLDISLDVLPVTETVIPEGAGEQDVSGTLGKTPKGESEGRGVALQERRTLLCEETQEGVPVHNNELSLDENITQPFLEGDSKEVKAAQLPEEVESNQQESLQNSDDGPLPLFEAVEEQQDNTEDTEKVGELWSTAGRFETAIQDPRLFIEEEEKESVEGPMKREIRCCGKDLGFGLEFQSQITDTPELQDVMDEAEPNKGHLNSPQDEGAEHNSQDFGECLDKLLEIDEDNMTGRDILEECEATSQTDRTQSEGEESAECAVINEAQSEDNSAEEERVTAELFDKRQRKTFAVLTNEMTTFEPENQTPLKPESEISPQLQTKEDSSHRSLNVIKGTKETDKSETDAPKAGLSTEEQHVIESSDELTEENCQSIRRSQDVIDEEILDLWLETVMSSTESPREGVSEAGTSNGVSPYLLEEDSGGFSPDSKYPSRGKDNLQQEANLVKRRTEEEWTESAGTQIGFQEHFDAERMNMGIIVPVNMNILNPVNVLKNEEPQEENVCRHLGNLNVQADQTRNAQTDLLEDQTDSAEGHAMYRDESWKERLEFKVPSLEEQQPEQSEESKELMPAGFEMLEDTTTKYKSQAQIHSHLLDLSPQKFRITVKNPRVRPPTNPRTLLNTPSMEPSPSSHAAPLGGVSPGIKLPGLGAAAAALRKTRLVSRDEKEQTTVQQKGDKETTTEDNGDRSKREEAQHKPRWMPPRQQGFGNPLMLELKTKLKKTLDE